ncbi:MAG TPA: M23 family metallopeptidase [Thermoleophilaceae bacterium]|nr:M23 family metallopeptidase [Thermoleophilaceae bacterium]
MPSGRSTYALSALAIVLIAAPATAAADRGSSSSAGGVMFVETPKIAKVACVKRCASHKRLQGGSTANISGGSLGQVTTAIFHGSAGSDDDVRAPVKPLNPRRLRAEVPTSAVTGPISLVTTAAVTSAPSAPIAILPPLPTDVLTAADHVFPVAGRHDFGGSGADFGSARSGHSHQGHDVFARCGTPLVAARGGKVQARKYHSAAGHYVVIDADDSGTDYVYMHLAERSPFRPGDSVATGQRIGSVGDSGNARGCHLHFELWSAPGYYQGGRPFDPLPALKAWDR